MKATDRPITPDRRARLGRIADVLLPGSGSMPSASASGAIATTLDAVLEARPDLVVDLVRTVDELDVDRFDLAMLAELSLADEAGYSAMTTVVAAAYYMTPAVRERIGYPGQVAKTYDPYAYVEWVGEGLLDPVIERGPIWRDPRDADPAFSRTDR